MMMPALAATAAMAMSAETTATLRFEALRSAAARAWSLVGAMRIRGAPAVASSVADGPSVPA